MAAQNNSYNILREPLIHFIVVAATLFFLYSQINDDRATVVENEIIVSRDDILTFMQYRAKSFDTARFSEIFANLTEAELDKWISDYVREEAMYREAKALNLDKNDYIAKQRLIQQFEFIAQGFVEAGTNLNEDDIQIYFDKHSVDYAVPAKITFAHVFFSDDRHGVAGANILAAEELRILNKERTPFHESMGHGDPAIYNVNYVQKEKNFVVSHFGVAMAEALFELPPDDTNWRGPFRSPYGTHLVLVVEQMDAFYPPIEIVRARVEDDARAALEASRLGKAIDAIVASYRVRRSDDLRDVAP